MAEGGEKRPSGSGDDDEKKYPEEERPSGSGDDKKKGKYPVGFRFKPTPDELVKHYLVPRLLGKKPTVTNDHIIEANAYECDPEILTEKYKERGEDGVWYFLSPRFRKYAGGDRPGRRTDDLRGRWKQSSGQSKAKLGVDAASTNHSKARKKKKLCVTGGTPGSFTEITLAYHLGSAKAKNETRSKWLMLELVAVPTPENGLIDSKGAADPSDRNLLDKYVMCKIYKSPMKKWREDEEGSTSTSTNTNTSSASTCEEEVALAASPQSSWPSAESIGETAAPTPSSTSRQAAGKRPAVEKPSGHANAPNKRVLRTTLAPGGSSAPMRPPVTYDMQGPVQQQQPPPPAAMYNSVQEPVWRRLGGSSSAQANGIIGGGDMSVPIGLRLGAAGYHELPGQPALMRAPAMYNSMPRVPVQPPPVAAEMYDDDSMRGPVHLQQQPPPPAMYNSMRGQMQLQHPSFMYRSVLVPNGQVPAQRPPPMVRLVPPPPQAAATGPNSLGGVEMMMMMRPPNLAAGRSVRPPPSFQRPPRQQQLQPVMEEDAQAHQERVFAQLLAAIKLQKEQQGSASCAGQQQQTAPPTASTPPAACLDEGVNDPAAVKVMAPHAQLLAPHDCYTCNGAQQQQQRSTPAVETSAADDAPGKRLSVPGGADAGSGNGDCYKNKSLEQLLKELAASLEHAGGGSAMKK